MAIDEVVGDIAEGLDDARAETWGEAATLTLLRVSGTTAPFAIVGTVDGGWLPLSAGTGGGMTVMIADLSAEFGAKLRRVTHLVVDRSVVPTINGIIWELRRGTTPPSPMRPTWLLRLISTGRVYMPPATEA